MKKLFVLSTVLIMYVELTGCGLEKIIKDAVSTMKPVQIVTGTIELQNASDHSGTIVKYNNTTTTTDANGHFRLTLLTSSAQSVNTLLLTHTGYATENIEIPAENNTGEYEISPQTLISMPISQKAIQNPLLFTEGNPDTTAQFKDEITNTTVNVSMKTESDTSVLTFPMRWSEYPDTTKTHVGTAKMNFIFDETQVFITKFTQIETGKQDYSTSYPNHIFCTFPLTANEKNEYYINIAQNYKVVFQTISTYLTYQLNGNTYSEVFVIDMQVSSGDLIQHMFFYYSKEAGVIKIEMTDVNKTSKSTVLSKI